MQSNKHLIMNVKFPQIKNFKKIEKNILETFKNHIISVWAALGLLLLIYAGYIFYSKVYASLTTTLLSAVKTQTAQREQLEQILQDLNEREQKRDNFDILKFTNPFKIRQ